MESWDHRPNGHTGWSWTFSPREAILGLSRSNISSELPRPLPVDFRSLISGADSVGTCKEKPHTDPDLKRLNVPPLITTDSEDSYTDGCRSLFRQAFSYAFFLGDFPRELESIISIRDPTCGRRLGTCWCLS